MARLFPPGTVGAPSLRFLQGRARMLLVLFLWSWHAPVIETGCAGIADSRPSQRTRRTGYPATFLPVKNSSISISETGQPIAQEMHLGFTGEDFCHAKDYCGTATKPWSTPALSV